jgi:hypothetical protein
MISIIVGCSRRKLTSNVPCAAIDLYQGGCVPLLRTLIKSALFPLERAFIVSARHGLLGACDLIYPYDEILTLEKAQYMRPFMADSIRQRVVGHSHSSNLIVLLEPLYFVTLGDLLAQRTCPRLFWFPDPVGHWPRALETLGILRSRQVESL